jgi:hypothetical protein
LNQVLPMTCIKRQPSSARRPHAEAAADAATPISPTRPKCAAGAGGDAPARA